MAALTELGVVTRLRALADEIEAATLLAPDPEPVAPPPPEVTGLAWGARVSSVFRERIVWLAEDLDIGPEPGKPEPNWVMTWIAWETGRSFRADVRNMAGSGATGLIQHMPLTALGYFYTAEQIAPMDKDERLRRGKQCCDRLAAMTAEDQINYVWVYFQPYKGKIRSLADGYMAILWPKAVGESEDFVLWDKASRPTTYRQNAGLDTNGDGQITKRETAAKVAALLPEGLKVGNVA